MSNVPFSGAEIRFLTTVSVDLGAITINYPYIREAPDVRHHCPLTPSSDATLCPDIKSLQLKSNPEISVIWSVYHKPSADDPVAVTPDGHVTNISMVEYPDDVDVYYVFKCTAADGCEDFVTIRPLDVDHMTNEEFTCGDPLVNGKDNGGTYEVITEKDIKTCNPRRCFRR